MSQETAGQRALREQIEGEQYRLGEEEQALALAKESVRKRTRAVQSCKRRILELGRDLKALGGRVPALPE